MSLYELWGGGVFLKIRLRNPFRSRLVRRLTVSPTSLVIEVSNSFAGASVDQQPRKNVTPRIICDRTVTPKLPQICPGKPSPSGVFLA
jgi:hypothetical protein